VRKGFGTGRGNSTDAHPIPSARTEKISENDHEGVKPKVKPGRRKKWDPSLGFVKSGLEKP